MQKSLVIAGLLALTAPAAAQQYEPTFPGCALCGVVVGYVDVPAPASTVSNAALRTGQAAVQGWGFGCSDGAPVDRVDIFVENAQHSDWWVPVPETPNTAAGSSPRPDVEAVYAGLCPQVVGRWPGFTRWLDQPLPLGAHRFLFVLWRGPYHTPAFGPGALIKTLNVVP